MYSRFMCAYNVAAIKILRSQGEYWRERVRAMFNASEHNQTIIERERAQRRMKRFGTDIVFEFSDV